MVKGKGVFSGIKHSFKDYFSIGKWKVTSREDMIFQGKLIKPHLLIFPEGNHRICRYLFRRAAFIQGCHIQPNNISNCISKSPSSRRNYRQPKLALKSNSWDFKRCPLQETAN
jgi:hypothetical protein